MGERGKGSGGWKWWTVVVGGRKNHGEGRGDEGRGEEKGKDWEARL